MLLRSGTKLTDDPAVMETQTNGATGSKLELSANAEARGEGSPLHDEGMEVGGASTREENDDNTQIDPANAMSPAGDHDRRAGVQNNGPDNGPRPDTGAGRVNPTDLK